MKQISHDLDNRASPGLAAARLGRAKVARRAPDHPKCIKNASQYPLSFLRVFFFRKIFGVHWSVVSAHQRIS